MAAETGLTNRLKVAEEAVKIVKKYNSNKWKDDRQRGMVELCTEIAEILDSKLTLELLVENQKTEIEELRRQISSAQTASSSGRGTSESNQELVLSGSRPLSCSAASSGHGTSLSRDQGTDPLSVWPDRVATCTRSTSPALLPSPNGMSSPLGSSEIVGGGDEASEKDENDNEVEGSTLESERGGVNNNEEGNDDTKNNGDDKSHAEAPTEGSDHDSSSEDRQRSQECEEDSCVRGFQENTEDADTAGSDGSISGPAERDDAPKENDETPGTESEDKAARSGPRGESPNRKKKNSTKEKQAVKKARPGARGEEKRHNQQRSKEPINKRVQAGKSPERTTPRFTNARAYKTMWKTSELNLFEESQSVNGKKSANSAQRGKPLVKKADQRNAAREVQDPYISESSESSEESQDEEEVRRKVQPELTSEYWDIHKLIRYLKIGNPTATVIVLCALRDLNLEQESCQVAIEQQGGLDLLLNILKTGHERCLIGALRILKQITNNKRINMEIYRLGGIEQLIQCLDNRSQEIQSLATETISHVVIFRKACCEVRRSGGLKKLVHLLRSVKLKSKKSTVDHDSVQLARNACMALWASSEGTKNIRAIRAAGAVPILASLLATGVDDVILPTVGILQECASVPGFREDVRTEGMIPGIIDLLKQGDQELKTLCASALFKLATDKEARELINRHGGLEPLAMLLRSKPHTDNKRLLSAAVGAVWQCALHENNVKKFEQLSILKTLILLLKNDQPNEVVTNLLGAMREFAYNKRNILILYEERVIAILVKLLNLTDSCVLINSTRLLAVCATEPYSRGVIFTSDGLRLLWSLFKSRDPKVIASAADAVTACVVDTEESAEIVRSFVGGLELITSLLKSDSREVLISATRAIVRIGQDTENMSIMTDYDVVPLLIQLCFTEDEDLRENVAEAIATGCVLEKNIAAFSPTVVPLADGLNIFKNEAVCKSTARALEKLSRDPANCQLIHEHGSLKYLLNMTGSPDPDLQLAAAGCVKNLRMNALSIMGC